MDEILLEGMRFYGYHGVNPEEQALGQRFVVDLSIAADLRQSGASDRLAETVNYSAVFQRVRTIVEGERYQLLEALAESIAGAILREFDAASGVTVTVRKPSVAIKGSILDSAGVRIRRSRQAKS